MFEKGDIIRWFYGRILGRPMNFSFVDDYVSGSAGPLAKKEIDWLRNAMGIQAILSLREGPLAKGWVEGLQYLNVPIRNHVAPTLEQLTGCVDYVMNQVSSGRKVLVHCAAGQGRTGAILAAYLCRRYGTNAEEAIRKIRSMRPRSIERNQESIVNVYSESLRKKDETEALRGSDSTSRASIH